MGLVNNLGTGVKDFFYEPWDGLASDGSLEAFLEVYGSSLLLLLLLLLPLPLPLPLPLHHHHHHHFLTLLLPPLSFQGLGKGTNSLVGNTMDGTMGVASKITGSLGHGLASLSLDSNYKRERARRKAQEAQSVSDGIMQVGGWMGVEREGPWWL